MWREETGFLEMFLAYYCQFERRVTSVRGYRDFLFDVLSLHERCHKFRKLTGEGYGSGDSYEDLGPVGAGWDSDSDVSYVGASPSPPRKKTMAGKSGKRPVPTSGAKRKPSQLPPENPVVPKATKRRVARESSPQTANEVLIDYINRSSSAPRPASGTKKRKPPPRKTPPQPKDNASERFQRRRDNRANIPGPEPSDEALANYISDSVPFSTQDDNMNHPPVPIPTIERCRFFCNNCDLIFDTAQDLRLHNVEHSGEFPYSCILCPMTFKSKNGLTLHSRIHTGYRPFICQYCPRSFVTKDSRRRHEKANHDDTIIYECKICNRRFKAQINLVRHEALHRGEKPFKCQYCDKAFAQHSHKRAHERVHTGDLPFKCSLCPKKFNNRTHCIAHIRVHNDERPYLCEKCGGRFRMMWYLKKHKCDPSKPRQWRTRGPYCMKPRNDQPVNLDGQQASASEIPSEAAAAAAVASGTSSTQNIATPAVASSAACEPTVDLDACAEKDSAPSQMRSQADNSSAPAGSSGVVNNTQTSVKDISKTGMMESTAIIVGAELVEGDPSSSPPYVISAVNSGLISGAESVLASNSSSVAAGQPVVAVFESPMTASEALTDASNVHVIEISGEGLENVIALSQEASGGAQGQAMSFVRMLPVTSEFVTANVVEQQPQAKVTTPSRRPRRAARKARPKKKKLVMPQDRPPLNIAPRPVAQYEHASSSRVDD